MRIEKKRVLLELTYDGRGYNGWESEDGGDISSQVKKAIKELTGEDVALKCLEPTEKGVSAKSNLAVFETESRIPGHQFAHYITKNLPTDIVVRSSEEHYIDWQPERYGTVRTYNYFIYNEEMRDPLRCHYAHHCSYELNLVEMQDACVYLKGEQNMATFTDDDPKKFGGKCRCCIDDLSIEVENPPIEEYDEEDIYAAYAPNVGMGAREELPDGIGHQREFNGMMKVTLKADVFYKNMMIIIVGCLLNVGTNIWPSARMMKAKDECDRFKAAEAAPKAGLVLEKVEFIKQMS